MLPLEQIPELWSEAVWGATNVAGYDVNVWSSPLDTVNNTARKYAMIGYHYSAGGSAKADPISGSIHVKAVNDVSLISNKFAVGGGRLWS